MDNQEPRRRRTPQNNRYQEQYSEQTDYIDYEEENIYRNGNEEKEDNALRKELKRLRYELLPPNKTILPYKENKYLAEYEKKGIPLPENIVKEGMDYYKVKENYLTKEEIQELLELRRTKYLRTIYNVFRAFVFMSIAVQILNLIAMLS